jgi:hypothetical protein
MSLKVPGAAIPGMLVFDPSHGFSPEVGVGK